MTVYIEYVLIDNFLIDYYLLKATFIITGISIKKGRLLLCAFLGALTALVFPLLTFNAYLSVFFKIVSGALIVLIGHDYASVKSFYVNFIIFVCLTFALGGFIIGIFSVFDIPYNTEISIALIFIPALLIIRGITGLIKYFYSRKSEENFFADCCLYFQKERHRLRGFIDTGNNLYHKGRPVIILNKTEAMKIIDFKSLYKAERILYHTAFGDAEMPVVLLEKVEITFNARKYNFNDIYMGIAKVGEKKLLLHPFFLEVKNETTS